MPGYIELPGQFEKGFIDYTANIPSAIHSFSPAFPSNHYPQNNPKSPAFENPSKHFVKLNSLLSNCFSAP